MGIHNLSKVIKTYAPGGIKTLQNEDMTGKVLALDTSNILYQFLIAVKDHIDDFKSPDGHITTHIHAILMKTSNLVKRGIKPIYVFDGISPSIKQHILDMRKSLKIKAIIKLQDETNEEEQLKLKKRSVYITKEQIKECKELLTLMGIPYVEAPEEADPQCVYLVNKKIADGVGSEDMDILTFGTKKLYRNISSTGKVVEYDLDIILKELEMTHLQFIDMCILLGCDYCPTIEGVGMKRAHDLIIEYGSIEDIIKNSKYKPSPEFLERYPLARKYFRKAPVLAVTKEHLKIKEPKVKELKELLRIKYGYSDKNIHKHINMLKCNNDITIKQCKFHDDEDMFSD